MSNSRASVAARLPNKGRPFSWAARDCTHGTLLHAISSRRSMAVDSIATMAPFSGPDKRTEPNRNAAQSCFSRCVDAKPFEQSVIMSCHSGPLLFVSWNSNGSDSARRYWSSAGRYMDTQTLIQCRCFKDIRALSDLPESHQQSMATGQFQSARKQTIINTSHHNVNTTDHALLLSDTAIAVISCWDITIILMLRYNHNP